MKIVTLNIWGGRLLEPLLEFIEKESQTVDIFCFQEVYSSSSLTYTRGDILPDGTPYTDLSQDNRARANIFSEIEKVLPHFDGIFHPAQTKADHISFVKDDLEYGLACFIKKGQKVNKIGNFFVHGSRNSMTEGDYSTLPRNSQYIKVPYKDSELTIVNFHGLWNGKGKTDSEARLLQSDKLKNFLIGQKGYLLLCGDFNLAPQTESLAILEKGMRNLVKEFGIISTRSSIYKKSEKFADYILISPGIEVLNFQVVQNEVSDHLPVVIEFK
jgi:exonuclease III